MNLLESFFSSNLDHFDDNSGDDRDNGKNYDNICFKVKPPGESFNDNVWHQVTVSRVTQRVSEYIAPVVFCAVS